MEPFENTSKSMMGQAASFLGRNGQSPLAADGPSDIQRSISSTPDSYTSRLNSSSEDETNAQRHRFKLAKLLKGKEEEWAAVAKRKSGPLKLLDLPLDILKEIIKEVTHTNDLASLALTHSALHNLVIPNIYSRFDIVWPDAHSAGESRTGVDALTYGLATLVMSEEIFEKNDTASRGYCETCACDKCMLARPSKANSSAVARVKTLRRGNNFPQYTRKFSLGNGPTEWVQEYLITKEGGKMLGTLVALSITRMHNLETFIWDMPTGILRDVWLSLASPSSCKSGQTPKLQKVWVRFHDNREIAAEPASPQVTATTHDAPDFPAAISNPVNLTSHSSFRGSAALYHDSYSRIQHPNFSILPPLKSLSVLDIDEIAYLSELSVAIEKSVSTLRELRISMALYLTGLDGWAEHPNMTGCLDSSGVIGAIMAKLLVNHFDTELPFSAAHAQHLTQNMTQETTAPILAQDFSEDQGLLSLKAKNGGNGIDSVNGSSPIVDSEASEGFSAPSAVASNFDKASSTKCGTSNDYLPSNQISSCDIEIGKSNVAFHESVRSKILGLEILEIESVALDVNVLQNTIDWSIITTLTLLRCGCHERLWKELRRKFAPRSNPNASKSLHTLSQSKSKRPCQSTFQPSSPLAYSLRLKKVHTDTVTPALISFLKDALAPNTLECMFLQDSGEYDSKVSLESIYRGPIRRHHASLKKLMIDSAVGMSDHTHYLRKKWMFNRDLLKFVTSGKMSMLKELAMAIDYEDWHFFLQRLPKIPHLRSLYIPYIADHVYGSHSNVKELALQLVDVVAIRPEVELLYIALCNKCFELLEIRGRDHSNWNSSSISTHNEPLVNTASSDDDIMDNDNDGENDPSSEADMETSPLAEGASETESDDGSKSVDELDEDIMDGNKTPADFRLREILFYDDKISIFKARHGRL